MCARRARVFSSDSASGLRVLTRDDWSPPGSAVTTYAGFWVRVGGYIIDSLVIGIPLGIIERAVIRPGSAGANALIYLAGAGVSIAYFVYFWSTSGQSLGQRAVGVRVVSADDGQLISQGRAFVRWLGIVISSIPLWLGLIWVAFDDRKQGWHDKMANTVVVRETRPWT